MKSIEFIIYSLLFILLLSNLNLIDGYENISLKTDEKPNNMKYIACKNNYILYDKHNEINKHIQNFYNYPDDINCTNINENINNIDWQFKEITEGNDNPDLYLKEKKLKKNLLIEPNILYASPNESIKLLYDEGNNLRFIKELMKSRIDIEGNEEDDKDYIMGHGWNPI